MSNSNRRPAAPPQGVRPTATRRRGRSRSTSRPRRPLLRVVIRFILLPYQVQQAARKQFPDLPPVLGFFVGIIIQILIGVAGGIIVAALAKLLGLVA